MSVTSIFNSIQAESPAWEPIFDESFYQKIVEAGFNRATIHKAFVLAQIVESLGPITLRGAFYRAVSAGVFRDTSDTHYQTAGNILLKLRRRWCVSYDKVVDSTRRRHKPSSWTGLSDFFDTVRDAYRRDLWDRQQDCVEFFIEKDAMAGIIQPVTDEFDVTLNVIRGDASETFVWNTAAHWNTIKKPIVAYYFGDHDPSGLGIESRLKEKLARLCHQDFQWKRLAITTSDFRREDLIGFTIKGDRKSKAWQTKHADYLDLFGDRCVEVDAIEPTEIRDRVRGAIESHIDQGEWARLKCIEAEEQATINKIALGQKVGGKAA